MQTQEVVIKPTLKVLLKSDSQNLEEVVVTAMGIKRSEKSLGYAVSNVKGDEITKARESNVLNSLSGKIAGLQIAQSSGTVGGSSSIQIRGASSIVSVSSPLFISISNGKYANLVKIKLSISLNSVFSSFRNNGSMTLCIFSIEV